MTQPDAYQNEQLQATWQQKKSEIDWAIKLRIQAGNQYKSAAWAWLRSEGTNRPVAKANFILADKIFKLAIRSLQIQLRELHLELHKLAPMQEVYEEDEEMADDQTKA